ncbi:MAG TPA: 3-oxoacyl-[acyl-carrier-protein] reductase [Syntrophales bacterium]|nr:3-oxoacyl-[acyl-carrier-protein] reductase [Syntrophales bacterium]
MNLEGKVALVTGGGRGIGSAVCRKLAEQGAFVHINYLRNEAAAAETLEAVLAAGGRASCCRFDVADAIAVADAVAGLAATEGEIDILVNNAGLSVDGLAVRQKEGEWRRVIDVNLAGVFHCCQAVIRPMMKKRWGRIVNLTSVVAETGNAGQTAYAASKAGVIGYTKSLARELGSRNICINAVSPGFVETEMTASVSAEARQGLLASIPLARFGTPADVAGVVAFLASEEAGYITGQILRVNGGLYI